MSGKDDVTPLLGKTVTAVRVEILFYLDDTKGVPVSVSIGLEDGFLYLFGCASDGSVFARPFTDVTLGTPPDYAALHKEIPELVGPVRRVDASGNGLNIVIGMRELQIVNDDDELIVLIDGHTPQCISSCRS